MIKTSIDSCSCYHCVCFITASAFRGACLHFQYLMTRHDLSHRGRKPQRPYMRPKHPSTAAEHRERPQSIERSSVSWLKSPSGWLESLPGRLLRQTFGVQMAWPSGRGPKGPFRFYRSQVIVTLCSQVPWRSIDGTTAPLSSIPFEADPLFPQHPGRVLGEQRVSWPRGVERDPEGPESFKMSQRCSERPREANKNLDSNLSSFSLFERMRCVAKGASQSSHFGDRLRPPCCK